jgi:hypothetical protein
MWEDTFSENPSAMLYLQINFKPQSDSMGNMKGAGVETLKQNQRYSIKELRN